jgi:WD40 repeat protein
MQGAGDQWAMSMTLDAVRVWDLAKGTVVCDLPWGRDRFASPAIVLTFTPDGQSLVALDGEYFGVLHAYRWRIPTGKREELWSATLGAVGLGPTVLSPDGKSFAVGTIRGVIRLFDLDTGKERGPAGAHVADVTAVAFSPDGRELTTTANDGTLRVWDTATGKPLSSTDIAIKDQLTLSPDGRHYFDIHWAGLNRASAVVTLRDPATGKVRHELKQQNGGVFHPDGTSLLTTASDDRTESVHRWDLKTGRELGSFGVSRGERLLGVTPGGRAVLVTEFGENPVRFVIRDADTGKESAAWKPQDRGLLRAGEAIHRAAVSPDGKLLAWGAAREWAPEDDKAIVYLCEAETGKVLWYEKGAAGLGDALAFSPDGKLLAVGGRTVKLHDAATGKVKGEFDGHRGVVGALAWAADGRRLASGSADSTAMVWDVAGP